jgi:hypothetical protein
MEIKFKEKKEKVECLNTQFFCANLRVDFFSLLGQYLPKHVAICPFGIMGSQNRTNYFLKILYVIWSNFHFGRLL